ncbi:alpha-hydroxy acid oxidase [Variovorax sp. N23]|uniref:alpha-hydroxy acid oxidase n=1 Tax=Variovorax sp. N23 TaxID=2980555 RepID=UPI0021C73B58|nr:alpha-hydroxy acid oxidase [Variovorax sp. N23]MCU4119082.1 alpha-hydroxy-acid oxidizing protein [Variovorax sp. N23]
MKLEDALNIADLRAAAKRRLPRALFEYVDRGAEDEIALATNRKALEALKIRPRVLRDVSRRSMEHTLFGRPLRFPIAVAPTAVAGMLWHDGDVLSARAAAAEGIPYTLSTYSVTALEKVAAAAPHARLWFQLYVSANRDHMRSLVGRAKDAGYEALVFTVDGAVSPKREYNARNGFGIPITYGPRFIRDLSMHPRWLLGVAVRYLLTTGIPGIAHHPGVDAPVGTEDEIKRALPTSATSRIQADPSINWETVRELRDLFPGRLLLKGILHPEDAKLALYAGVDGIVVSNHGGRSLDASIATIDALPDIVAAVGGRLPVLVDGAFYRGSDIVKALALGASTVLIGRSVLWGVASFGEPGARRAIRILGEEIDRVMAQTGCTSPDQLSRQILWRRTA